MSHPSTHKRNREPIWGESIVCTKSVHAVLFSKCTIVIIWAFMWVCVCLWVCVCKIEWRDFNSCDCLILQTVEQKRFTEDWRRICRHLDDLEPWSRSSYRSNICNESAYPLNFFLKDVWVWKKGSNGLTLVISWGSPHSCWACVSSRPTVGLAVVRWWVERRPAPCRPT